MGKGPGEPFASASVETENSSIGLWNLEKNPINHQAAWIVTEVMRLVRSRDKDMSGHEWIFFVEGVEDKVSFEAEAELHAARVIMEVGSLSDGEKIAESENGNAVDAVLTEVKDPITGLVAIGYFVGYHLARIISNNSIPIGYKKIIERNMPTSFENRV